MKLTERTIKREAFTLLEIIIAICMVALILGGVYGTYTATIRSLEHSKPRHVLQKQAHIFLQRIASELRCCYAGYENESLRPSIKSIRTIGESRIRQQDVSLFKGGEVLSGQSILRFVTSEVNLKQKQVMGGLVVIEYMMNSSKNTLLRSERRYIDGLNVDSGDCNWFVVLEDIQTVTVEYFNGKEWLKGWDSNDMEKSLPKAVRVSLVMQSGDVGPMSFLSTIPITCREYQSTGVVGTTIGTGGILQSINNNQKPND
ncbi:MAG: hypothetical protein JW837_11985 [Sedimentisphaerales bacterium]|nr:hypothetical protein [Sedimentisphaerales bacterium]